MSEEPKRTGANPAEPDIPAPPAVAFDLNKLLEQQLTEGLALIQYASGVAQDSSRYDVRDRNNSIGVASRVMIANVRSAESLTRFSREKEKERIYREIAQMKRSKAEEAHLRLTPVQRAMLDAQPSAEEFRRRRAAEHKRIADGLPINGNTAWLDWYWDQYPAWLEIEREIDKQTA